MGHPHFRLTRQETDTAFGDAAAGRTVVLGDEIGSGSSATVYRAKLVHAWGIERPIAVKVFDATASDDRDAVLGTMAAAARGVAQLHHPNVAQVYEFGVLDGARPFVFEELVDGASLPTLIADYESKGQRVPLDLALFLGVEIAEGLDGARTGAGSCDGASGGRMCLVHGDLSAREVLLSKLGEVKLTDFGGASAARVVSSIRSYSSVAKRAATIAPEVIGGDEPGPRSDVFSLGTLLWEMLVGPRFPRDLEDASVLLHARAGYVHTTVFDPQLPAPLKAVLRRALDPDPSKRFPHAGAFAFELRRIALAMGVGDGRVFLRYAVKRLRGEGAPDDAMPTGEIEAVPTSSDLVVATPASGTVRKATRAEPPVS